MFRVFRYSVNRKLAMKEVVFNRINEIYQIWTNRALKGWEIDSKHFTSASFLVFFGKFMCRLFSILSFRQFYSYSFLSSPFSLTQFNSREKEWKKDLSHTNSIYVLSNFLYKTNEHFLSFFVFIQFDLPLLFVCSLLYLSLFPPFAFFSSFITFFLPRPYCSYFIHILCIAFYLLLLFIYHFLAFVRKFVRYVSIYWFGLKLKKKKYNNYKQTTNHQDYYHQSFIISVLIWFVSILFWMAFDYRKL